MECVRHKGRSDFLEFTMAEDTIQQKDQDTTWSDVSTQDILAEAGLGQPGAQDDDVSEDASDASDAGDNGDETNTTDNDDAEASDEGGDGDDDGSEDSDNGDQGDANDDDGSNDDGDDGDADGDGDEDKGDDGKPVTAVKKLQKRVNKLTARMKSAEEERDALKAQLAQATAPHLTPTADNPLASLDTEEKVNDYVRRMESVREWCLDNMDGGEVEGKDGSSRSLSAGDVRRHLAQAERGIKEDAPKRLAYLRERGSIGAEARKAYPQMFDGATVQSQMFNAFVSQFPDIVKLPNYEMIIGDAIAGMAFRMAAAEKAKGDANGAAKPPVTPKKPIPKPGPRKPVVAPVETKPTDKKVNHEAAKRAAQGDSRAMEDYIESTL